MTTKQDLYPHFLKTTNMQIYIKSESKKHVNQKKKKKKKKKIQLKNGKLFHQPAWSITPSPSKSGPVRHIVTSEKCRQKSL